MSDVHDALTTSVNSKNGAISAQIGDSTSSEVVSDEAEWIQHVGFASRPSKAVAGQPSCQVLTIETTGRDVCYASRDLRGTTAYGALGDGETCIFANGPNGGGTGLVIMKDDGSAASAEMSVRRGNASSGGKVRVSVSSDGKVTIETGTASIVVDAVTGAATITATSVALGGSGGLPVVVDGGTLQAWITTVATGLNGLGVVNTPPVGIVSTKVTAV